MSPREFIKQIIVMMSGNAGALVIGLLSMPILSRLYTPEDFGAVSVFLVLTNLLAIVLPMRYFRAAIIERDEEHALTLMALSSWLLIVGAVLVTLIIAVIEMGLLRVPFIEPLGHLVWLLPPSVLLVGFTQILFTANVKQQRFDRIARSDVSESLLSAVFRIVYGVLNASTFGLIAGFLVGKVVRLLILMKHVMSPLALLRHRPASSDVRRLAKEYDEYPRHSMPSGLLIALSAKMPVLILASVYAPAVVGFYAVADRLVRSPVLLASNSVREVFLRKLTGGRKRTTYVRPFMLVTLGMFVVGVLPFGLMAYIGGDVLVFILGDRWVEAGAYVEVLVPWYFSTWVISGVQPSLVAMRKQGVWLSMQVVIIAVRAGVLSAGFYADAAILDVLGWYAYTNVGIALVLLLLTVVLMQRHQAASTLD